MATIYLEIYKPSQLRTSLVCDLHIVSGDCIGEPEYTIVAKGYGGSAPVASLNAVDSLTGIVLKATMVDIKAVRETFIGKTE